MDYARSWMEYLWPTQQLPPALRAEIVTYDRTQMRAVAQQEVVAARAALRPAASRVLPERVETLCAMDMLRNDIKNRNYTLRKN